MQWMLKDGTVLAMGGCARDAELEFVGQDSKRVCKVGLAVGKRSVQGQDKPETVWCNVVAWHNLASILSAAKKGDPVFVIGKLKSREYNSKTYTDLVADFVSVCSISAVTDQRMAQGVQPAGRGVDVAPPGPGFDFSDDPVDGELPF